MQSTMSDRVAEEEHGMSTMSRREALVSAGAVAIGSLLLPNAGSSAQRTGRVVKKGNLKQSVSRWCYQKILLPDFCRAVAEMGLTAIDLLKEDEWDVVREYGLICSMGYGGGGTIPDGMNVKANHDAIVKNFEKSIPHASKAGVPNVITFFGNRRGMSDAEASANCVEG